MRQKRDRCLVRTTRGTCIRIEIHPKNCDTFVSNTYCCTFNFFMQGKLAFQARYVQVNTRENLERSREVTLRLVDMANFLCELNT